MEQLISDARIPPERRVQYALKAIAGLRHGEVAGLRWRHYDPALEPLGRLVIATSYDTGRTNTEVTRRVPVHPKARPDPRGVEDLALGAHLRPRADP